MILQAQNINKSIAYSNRYTKKCIYTYINMYHAIYKTISSELVDPCRSSELCETFLQDACFRSNLSEVGLYGDSIGFQEWWLLGCKGICIYIHRIYMYVQYVYVFANLCVYIGYSCRTQTMGIEKHTVCFGAFRGLCLLRDSVPKLLVMIISVTGMRMVVPKAK